MNNRRNNGKKLNLFSAGKERICLGGEVKRARCCGRCGDYGNNRKTCKRPIPLHPRDEHSCVNIVENKINIQ